MATDRRFCRFNRAESTVTGKIDHSSVSTREIPEGGLCLSVFLIITDTRNQLVLMGHLNPNTPWDHIGALDSERVNVHRKRWMLPSSHLMIHESPQEAASRVASEQLNIKNLKFAEPKVVSEVYTPKRFQEIAKHWDIEFIFNSIIDKSKFRTTTAWTDLKFINPKEVQRSSIARSHDDILVHAGFKFGP